MLKINDKGHAFLKKPHSIKFTRDHDYSNTDKSHDDDDIVTGGRGAGAADQTLFAMLKDVTKKIAAKHSLPPYVIFQETSLEEMTIQYPTTLDELAKITGVGQGKAGKFGNEIIKVIKKYVDENEIERPSDMVIKSVVNKSGLKVYIIQNVDRKISLTDMAKSKSLKMNDLLTEMETIVASGTKLNINYYIEDAIDEEKQDEIIEYFKESKTDSVDVALKELGENDYTRRRSG